MAGLRHTLRAGCFSRRTRRREKRLNLIRGLRAANSVRPEKGSSGIAGRAFLDCLGLRRLLENGGQRIIRRKCRHKDTARLAAVGRQVEIPSKERFADIERLKIAGGMFILRGYAVRAKG